MPFPSLVKRSCGLSFSGKSKPNLIARVLHFVMLRKAKIVWSRINEFVKGPMVLDVGMGSGSITYLLKSKGFRVKSVDVGNLSIYEDLKPVIYDGFKIPFKSEFDLALVVHVLHHCEDGLRVLNEAKRVAKRVILIEDTYRNWLEWLVIAVSDAVNNGEFWFHKYRKFDDWQKYIERKGWKIIHSDQWSEYGVAAVYGRYCLFVIE